jgi:hypothetical protein
MEGSKRITKVFGQLRFDYHAQRISVRQTSTPEDMEHYDEPEPSVRYARVKSPPKSKSRGRSQP